MRYDLTLNRDEREAIDWIGDRYRHGYELYKLLWCECDHTFPWPEIEDADWSDNVPIAFDIPEYVAWQIREIVYTDDLTCFSDSLKEKLRDFCDKIV